MWHTCSTTHLRYRNPPMIDFKLLAKHVSSHRWDYCNQNYNIQGLKQYTTSALTTQPPLSVKVWHRYHADTSASGIFLHLCINPNSWTGVLLTSWQGWVDTEASCRLGLGQGRKKAKTFSLFVRLPQRYLPHDILAAPLFCANAICPWLISRFWQSMCLAIVGIIATKLQCPTTQTTYHQCSNRSVTTVGKSFTRYLHCDILVTPLVCVTAICLWSCLVTNTFP